MNSVEDTNKLSSFDAAMQIPKAIFLGFYGALV